MAIPSNASLIFTISLPPALSQKQMTEIIPLEARKYIPVPINEVSLDWWILPEPGDQNTTKTDVLVVAIHNETMRRYSDMSRSMDLNTSFYEAEIFSSIRAAFFRELSATVLVDFGAAKTKVAIVEYGLVRDFHIINKGSQDISNAISTALSVSFIKAEQMKREMGLHAEDGAIREASEFIVDYIISELSGFILNYERMYGKLVTKVVVSGGGSLLIGLTERMSTKLNLPVDLSTPFDRLETPKVLDPVLRRIGAEFAVAIGLALRKVQVD
jgi:type IV pilus assembly protein PilM